MAWISVHEQVIGGKLRNLAKEIGCSQNEALGILIRMWLWAINNAEEDGLIVGADKEDVAEVLTIGLDRRYRAEDVVDALVSTRWIDMENGLYIHDWEEWQEQWYKAIKRRKDNAESQRKSRERKRELSSRQMAAPSESGGNTMEDDLPSPQLNITLEDEPKKKPESDYTKDFEDFWDAYPRKVGKGEAYKKYKARLNDGWSEKELLEAAKNYASRVSADRTEQKYIKHAKTFLSDNTPFTDFLPKETGSSVNDDEDPYGAWR